MIGVLLMVAAVTHPPVCDWSQPGANPYRGDVVQSLADYALPDLLRIELQDKMRRHEYDDVATITKDTIVGPHGQYGELRDMHFGQKSMCHGPVDQSAWSPQRTERGLVYCVGQTCVIVPTICNNVSLLTRKDSEEPIDIEPAAGPVGPSGGGGGVPTAPTTPLVEAAAPQDDARSFIQAAQPAFPTSGFSPIVAGDGPPVFPPHHVSPVPEPSSLRFLAIGLLALFLRHRK